MPGQGRYFFFRLRFGGQVGRDLFLRAAGLDAEGERFGVPVGLCIGVLLFDQQPLVTFAAILHGDDGEGAVQLFAMQAKFQVAAGKLSLAVFFPEDLEDAAIP